MKDILITQLQISRVQPNLDRLLDGHIMLRKTDLVGFGQIDRSYENVMKPEQTTFNTKCLLLNFIGKQFPTP